MLNFQTYSKAPSAKWVVFIHGAGGSIKTWKYQVEEFEKYFNILILDLRDHGQSKEIHPQADKYTFALISADIKKVLDHLEIINAHFLSLSMGSVLIQDFYLRHPEMVNRVIIAGGVFKGNLVIKSFVRLARILNIVLSYKMMYSLFSYLLMPLKRNQLAREIYQTQAAKLTRYEYLKWVGLYGEFFDLLYQFYNQKIEIPMLIVMGGDDYVFLKAARKFNLKNPMTQMLVIPKAGHVVNIEAAKAFNDASLKFLV